MKPTRAELQQLLERDALLAEVAGDLGAFPGFPDASRKRRSTYECLASAIVGQQISGKAAETIWGRCCALTPGSGFPTATEVRGLAETQLRAAGLSANKQKAVRDLCARSESGELVLGSLWRRSDDEVIEAVSAVRGLGVWSAQMLLMFKLGRLDVMPATDLGVQEGLRLLRSKSQRPTPKEALRYAERWAPLRSVGAWWMWRLVDHRRRLDSAASAASEAGKRSTDKASKTNARKKRSTSSSKSQARKPVARKYRRP